LRQSDVAARSGDQAGERRASIQALMHARSSGSRQMLALGLSNLADSYLRTNEYVQSLQYSKEALSIAKTLHRNALEQTVLFNMGIATIHVGSVKRGAEMIEAVINTGIGSGDVADAAELLHEYGQALEQAGQWQTALTVFHREAALREQLLSATRQRSLLELEAKFNDVRKTREIEILKRDNALQRANLAAEQFRQKAILIAAALAIVVCVLLSWAFSRLRKAGAQLRYASEHDTLTGLHNRRYFNDNILQSYRDRGFHGCLILIDVDHFKRINDVLGHPTGDAVLTVLGERLSGSLRAKDTLVRWGGEEFLAVLDPLSESELNATVGRLLNIVETSPVLANGQSVECTVSIGCARFPIQGAVMDIALERAITLVDKALYRAKSAGRNRACFIRAIHSRSEHETGTSINASFEGATGGELVALQSTG
jgi:diguanylate cyclase (GGDEF)-like protein